MSGVIFDCGFDWGRPEFGYDVLGLFGVSFVGARAVSSFRSNIGTVGPQNLEDAARAAEWVSIGTGRVAVQINVGASCGTERCE